MFLYQDSISFFHRLHPVTRLVLLLAMITAPFLAVDLPQIGLFLAAYLAMLLLGAGKNNLRSSWKLLIVFWVFAFLIWIIIPRLRGVHWSYQEAAVLATRIDCFVLAGLLFVTTTRTEEFTYALTHLGIPYRPAFALSLGFRLVPLFYQNLQTIVAAQKSRGVDLESGGIGRRVRKYVPILAILISYGIRNADLMAMSLEAKGFGYSSRRTSFLQPRFGWRDAVIAAFVLTGCLAAALGWMRVSEIL